jgi:hypothetical protein
MNYESGEVMMYFKALKKALSQDSCFRAEDINHILLTCKSDILLPTIQLSFFYPCPLDAETSFFMKLYMFQTYVSTVPMTRARMAQLVYTLAMGWMTDGSEFEPQ